MKEGSCGFVLPKYNKVKYINIKKGSEFGAEDIISCIVKNDYEDDDEWIHNKDQLIRQFTVMADQSTELLLLSISDLRRMQSEFVGAFNRLLENAYERLEFILLVKLDCTNQCQEKEEKRKKRFQKNQRVSLNHFFPKFDFIPVNLIDIDKSIHSKQVEDKKDILNKDKLPFFNNSEMEKSSSSSLESDKDIS